MAGGYCDGSFPEYWSASVEEFLREQRKTNRILLLAFGEAIENRVRGFLAHAPTRTVLTILAEGEIAADALQAKAKASGMPRSTLYRILSDLERAGIIERPRRGTVEIASFAVPFIPAPRKAGAAKEGEPADELEQPEMDGQPS